jgi:hypothetical protein
MVRGNPHPVRSLCGITNVTSVLMSANGDGADGAMARFGELRRATSNRAARPIALGAPSVSIARGPVDDQFVQIFRKRSRVLQRSICAHQGASAGERGSWSGSAPTPPGAAAQRPCRAAPDRRAPRGDPAPGVLRPHSAGEGAADRVVATAGLGRRRGAVGGSDCDTAPVGRFHRIPKGALEVKDSPTSPVDPPPQPAGGAAGGRRIRRGTA